MPQIDDPRNWKKADGTTPLQKVNTEKPKPMKRPSNEAALNVESMKKMRIDDSEVFTSGSQHHSPKGLSWDDYSCAYDSLFTMLYNWYTICKEGRTHVLLNSTQWMHQLALQFDKVSSTKLTLDTARDNVRTELHDFDSVMFPSNSTQGTSLSELVEIMLRENSCFAAWKNRCQSCNKTNKDKSLDYILWYCSREAWKATSTHVKQYRVVSVNKWIDILSHTSTTKYCTRCNGSIINELVLTRNPCYLPIWVEEKVTIKWDLTVMIDKCSYQLCGLIYFDTKAKHFTARVIGNDGSIWYHDGLTTQGQCFYEGNMITKKPKFFSKCHKGYKCICGLYIIKNSV